MADQVPKTFNWVEARAKCSLEQLFIALREVVESDTKEMDRRLIGYRGGTASMTMATDTKFIVVKQRDAGGIMVSESVVFERTASGIAVKDGPSQRQILVATHSFTVAGECKLFVDDQPLELWQVSRKALEALFFGA